MFAARAADTANPLHCGAPHLKRAAVSTRSPDVAFVTPAAPASMVYIPEGSMVYNPKDGGAWLAAPASMVYDGTLVYNPEDGGAWL